MSVAVLSFMSHRIGILCGCGVFLCIITPYICPSVPLLPLAPICVIAAKGSGGETQIDGIICGLVMVTYFVVISYPISLIFFFIPYHWCLLTAYLFAPIVYGRNLIGIDTEHLAEKLWFKVWLSLFWNPPLLFAWNIVSYFGGQLGAPLVNIIDDNIGVGALPCSASNVLKLYGDPHHIRGVICMCDESSGPIQEYEKYKIKYIQLKTLDATPPQIGNIDLGIKFIEEFIEWRDTENSGLGRVFIHCKAGRGRAVTMATCWLLSRGFKPKDAINLITSKRKGAHRGVMEYSTVKHFIKKYEK